jgi:hypothetical protein
MISTPKEVIARAIAPNTKGLALLMVYGSRVIITSIHDSIIVIVDIYIW